MSDDATSDTARGPRPSLDMSVFEHVDTHAADSAVVCNLRKRLVYFAQAPAVPELNSTGRLVAVANIGRDQKIAEANSWRRALSTHRCEPLGISNSPCYAFDETWKEYRIEDRYQEYRPELQEKVALTDQRI
eukprot:gene2141-18190_t